MNTTIEFLKSGLSKKLKVFKARPLNQQLILTGLVVGIASGASAYVFQRMVEGVTAGSMFLLNHLTFTWRVVATLAIPALGGIVTGILTHIYCPDAKGHGIMEVSDAIKEKDGHIHGRVAWYKLLASTSTVGSGGSTGREGPIVQIGAAVASSIGRRLGVSKTDLKMLVAAGAAGGLGASFSIPLAAVFFVMEVVLKNFANEAFPALVISSVTASATARVLLGGSAFMPTVTYQWNSPNEFVFYAILGVLCAPVGVFYRASVEYFEHGFAKMERLPDWVRPAIGGFLVGAVALVVPEARGMGQEVVNGILVGRIVGLTLFTLAIGKILTTSLTLGSGGSGGALMPSLFVGAAVGGFFSHALHRTTGIFIEPGAMALVGMAGIFTAAFQAPFTAIIMIVEITRDYGILMPVMFGSVMAFLFSKQTTSNSDHTLPSPNPPEE